MTQLIENKPRRRAMIATLSHYVHCGARLVCISNSEIPRLKSRVSQRKQTAATESNSEFSRVFPSYPTLLGQLVAAFLIDRGYQLELALTHRKQTATANSNRRWIAKLRSANFVARIPLPELSGGESR
jgi:hypothetical protein